MPYNKLVEDPKKKKNKYWQYKSYVILYDNVATNFLISYINSILMFNIQITFYVIDTQPVSSHGHPYPSNTI